MTGVQTCALPICFPVTISESESLLLSESVTSEQVLDQIKKINDSNLVSKEEIVSKLKSKYNQINNIKETSYKVLYDFKDKNPRIKLSSFVIFNSNYYILDSDTSKIYSSKVSELNFESYETKVSGARYIDNFTKTLAIINNSSIFYFTPDLNKSDNEIKLDQVGIPRVYSGFIYELKDNKITRIDSNSDKPSRELWAENEKLVNAKDLFIDYDVYVLDKDSKLLKFSSGVLQDLKFENDKYSFSKMFINSNLTYNYFVSDNKIYQYSKDGILKTIYSDPFFNEDIKDLVVLSDKKIIFISNSKLVELEL